MSSGATEESPGAWQGYVAPGDERPPVERRARSPRSGPVLGDDPQLGYEPHGGEDGLEHDNGYDDDGYYDEDDYYDDDYDDGPYVDPGPDQADPYGQRPVDDPPYRSLPVEGRTGGHGSRRQRREEKFRGRAQAREARWQRHRLAVPYRTDGPKLTLGVLWFALLMGAIAVSPLLVVLLVSLVAALAGLQTGFAWFPRHAPTRWWAAVGAFAAGLLGIVGSMGVVLAVVVGLAVSVAYAVSNPSRSQSTMALVEVAMRAIVPAGVAAAALGALAGLGTGAAVALVAMVSAYEVGDFLVGSGSVNAVEGPISGLVSVAAVVFILWVVTPTPFTSSSMVLFGVLTGVGCIVGQIFASAVLPRGAAWAPALRRLDSYLLVAPIWVLLLASLPDATSL